MTLEEREKKVSVEESNIEWRESKNSIHYEFLGEKELKHYAL
jgi:hypothetical protein